MDTNFFKSRPSVNDILNEDYRKFGVTTKVAWIIVIYQAAGPQRPQIALSVLIKSSALLTKDSRLLSRNNILAQYDIYI